MMRGIHIIRKKEQRNVMSILAEDSCLAVRPAEVESTKQ